MKTVALSSSIIALSAMLFAAPALAQRNGWAETCTQGGSGNEVDCNRNPGVTEVEQPKGQVEKEGSNSPCDAVDGPQGQLNKQDCRF
jgi:hypothetical protein